MTAPFRTVVLVLALAFATAAAVYVFSWSQTKIGPEAAELQPEQQRLRDELIKLSSDLNAQSLEGRACRATIARHLFELRKNGAQARLNLISRARTVVQRDALVAALIVAGLACILIGLAEFVRARHAEAKDTGSRWTASNSLGAGILALLGLALHLGLRADPPSTPVGYPITLDMAAFVERCEDYKRPEE